RYLLIPTLFPYTTLFRSELQLADEKLIMTVLIIQVVAAFGAYGFARFSEKRGNKLSLMTMIAIWIGVCLAAYFVYTEYQFYALRSEEHTSELQSRENLVC